MRKMKILNFLRTYSKMFVIFVVISLLTTFFSFQYYQQLHTTIREESKNYLQEVSRRVGTNINRIIQDNYAVMNTMVDFIESSYSLSSELRYPLLLQKENWNYDNIMFIDDTGKIFDITSNQIAITLEEKMRTDILNNKNSMSTTQVINNKEYILFSVPISIPYKNRNIVALATSFSPNTFNEILSMTSFDEKAYSQIITKSGTAITKPTSEYAINAGYNIFSSLLSNAKFDNTLVLDNAIRDINNNLEGQISFKQDGVSRYMVYTPISSDDWYLITFVPTQVVNQKSDLLLRSTLVISGVIALIFSVLIVSLVMIFNNNKRKLEKIAYVDDITNGNTIQRFYDIARSILDTSGTQDYVLVYTNIEKFKILNEQLGRETCNQILRYFNNYVNDAIDTSECMGRIGADNFALLLKYTNNEEILKRFMHWQVAAEQHVQANNLAWSVPTTEFGIYLVTDKTVPFTQMIDCAKLSLKDGTRIPESRIHYAFYNDEVRKQLYREKQIEDMMEYALANHEFEVYLQPKYRLPEETVQGAEALVRWISPRSGMIYPNEFISLFEKNGFIIPLDIYVFEEVCKTLRRWIDKNMPVVKISINCSRLHFKDPNFIQEYVKIANQYEIDRGLIEIELTESIVFDNSERLLSIIDQIKQAGFGCSMDDFGSGYSSLNLLHTIPVDTIKLDKVFFEISPTEYARSEAILASIINMANALSMETVAEGVELREQVEMLKRVGCDFIQGYIFAKPMEIKNFEKLLKKSTK